MILTMPQPRARATSVSPADDRLPTIEIDAATSYRCKPRRTAVAVVHGMAMPRPMLIAAVVAVAVATRSRGTPSHPGINGESATPISAITAPSARYRRRPVPMTARVSVVSPRARCSATYFVTAPPDSEIQQRGVGDDRADEDPQAEGLGPDRREDERGQEGGGRDRDDPGRPVGRGIARRATSPRPTGPRRVRQGLDRVGDVADAG